MVTHDPVDKNIMFNDMVCQWQDMILFNGAQDQPDSNATVQISVAFSDIKEAIKILPSGAKNGYTIHNLKRFCNRL